MAVPGAGDIAHVYLLELGPDLAHEETEYVTYDDATQQLLAVKGGHVFAYDVSRGPAGHTALKWMYPLQEGPRVIGLRPSLDNRLLALQRSPAMLELVDLSTGMCFVHSIHQGRGSILTFFFTDAPDTDLVIVTTRAVELTQFAARRQGLRCRERVRGTNAWALHSHETRMVVVGCAAPGGGGGCAALSAWQFASHGIVHLPLFELQGRLPQSPAVRQFLHGTAAAAAAGAGATTQQQQQQHDPSHTAAAGGSAPLAAAAPAGGSSGAAAAAAAAGGVVGSSHRRLDPSRLWLLKMYGRVYLAHADSAGGCRLELYRFYTDTIILQHVYELCSSQVQLSVVDNTLVVHHTDTSVVMSFDVALSDDGRGSHLVNPLPLRRLTLLPPALAAAVARQGSSGGQAQGGEAAAASAGSSGSMSRAGSRSLLRAGSSGGTAAGGGGSGVAAAAGEVSADDDGSSVYEASEAPHGPGWSFFMPGVILDAATKSIGRLQLDLQAIADSATDWPALVGFLLRRRPLPPGAPLAADPRRLLLQVARNALQERLGLAALRQIFDRLLQAYADAVARTAAPTLAAAAAVTAAAAHAGGGGGSGAPASRPPPLLEIPAVTVITPHELARDLFQWVHDEEVVDALYLQAAVGEYCAASAASGLPPPPYLQLLALDLLLQQEQHYQAVQLLASQPGSSSAGLARHLLDVATGGKDPGGGLGIAVSPLVVGPSPFSAAAAAGGDVAADGAGVESASVQGAAMIGAATTAMIVGRRGGCGGFDASSPGAAVALELALDVLARQAAAELRPAGGTAHSGQHGAIHSHGGGSGSGSSGGGLLGQTAGGGATPRAPAAAALVRQLLGMGQVLRAARVAAAAGGAAAVGVPAAAFLEAAAAAGDGGAFTAVYRAMRGQLAGSWPDCEAARRCFWGGQQEQEAGAMAIGAGGAAVAVEAA